MRERYIYSGNRSTVLRKMISMNLKIDLILPMKNSLLEKECSSFHIPYKIIHSKQQLIDIYQI